MTRRCYRCNCICTCIRPCAGVFTRSSGLLLLLRIRAGALCRWRCSCIVAAASRRTCRSVGSGRRSRTFPALAMVMMMVMMAMMVAVMAPVAMSVSVTMTMTIAVALSVGLDRQRICSLRSGQGGIAGQAIRAGQAGKRHRSTPRARPTAVVATHGARILTDGGHDVYDAQAQAREVEEGLADEGVDGVAEEEE